MSQEEPKQVSSCPKCGAPVYAQAKSGGGVPRTIYSCDCRNQTTKKTNSTGGGMFKTGAVGY